MAVSFGRIGGAVGMKQGKGSRQPVCESCAYYYYDEEYSEHVCNAAMDEDELSRLAYANKSGRFFCSYFRPYDEYGVVRRQM